MCSRLLSVRLGATYRSHVQPAPGLDRFGNDIVAPHLIVTDEGITLIDTGLPGHDANLSREFTAIGRPFTDIRGVVLSHGDSDHVGFSERLRIELQMPVCAGARVRGCAVTVSTG